MRNTNNYSEPKDRNFTSIFRYYLKPLAAILVASIGYMLILLPLVFILKWRFGWFYILALVSILLVIVYFVPFYKFKSNGSELSKLTVKVALKRLMDICIVSTGLMALLPLLLIIPVMIKRDSPGPVLCKREAIGRYGRKIYLYYFRTLYIDTEARSEISGKAYESSFAPRITKFGRFLLRYSLDTLPQLLNVFIGDLSLVGPRAITPKQLDELDHVYISRFNVPPGITGLWQVSNQSKDDMRGMFDVDLEYINKFNIILDLKILINTMLIVFDKKFYLD